MAADLKQFPLEDGRGVDEGSGLLCSRSGLSVNFEPMRVWAGDCLVPLKADLEYQVAVYSPMPDPQYIYTYSYPPEANLTKFLPDESVFQWKTGLRSFSEPAYIRLVVRADIQTEKTTLADFFRWEDKTVREEPSLRYSGKEGETLPVWIEEEAERVARRVQHCRRAGDLVFFLLTDIHYTTGCNWPWTAASLAAVKQRVKAEGIIQLGDITDGLLPTAWTERYAGRVLADIKALGLPVIGCLGNHDRNFFRGNSQGLSLRVCSQMCLGRDDPDYCMDFPEQRLRMIFLDSFDPQRKDRYGFSEDTVRRFGSMLEHAPEGFRILVFSHVPPLAKLHVWSDSILRSGEMIGLLQRFCTKRGGTVLGWIHGHNHADQIDTSVGFPIVSTGCSKLEAFPEHKPAGSVTRMRRLGEPSQELWEVLVVHACSRDFDLIRYGAGIDRYVLA